MNIENFLKKEHPLEPLTANINLCSIFRTIGCVGDSLSSGEFEELKANGERHYHDLYEYSWGQFMARDLGCKVYNFSKGGMTAEKYCQGFAEENGFWDADKACQAYIFALGVNDIWVLDKEVGSPSDVDLKDYRNNKPTFAGYYAQIIQRLKEISPDAKFFFMTMPQNSTDSEHKKEKGDLHAKLMYDFAEMFSNSYVIDLRKYAPDYNSAFREKYFLGGHMNPVGYVLTACMVETYIDYIIRNNMEDFKQVGFIGTEYKYVEQK